MQRPLLFLSILVGWTGLCFSQDATPLIQYVTAPVNIASSCTGCSTTNIPGYQVVIFTNSGTLTISGSGTATALVVAGGGAGGCNGQGYYGGGGGGGGQVIVTNLVLSAGPISVTVGCGGLGDNSYHVNGRDGSNSVFGTIVAIGGKGGGGSYAVTPGGNSGSGKFGGGGTWAGPVYAGGGAGDSQNGGTPAGGNGTTVTGFGFTNVYFGGGGVGGGSGGLGGGGSGNNSPSPGGLASIKWTEKLSHLVSCF